jgi:hypothetical protein
MLIYKIQLSKETDAEAFVTFMSEEYIPAVNKNASRIGQVTDLVLLQADTTGDTGQFLWYLDGILMYPRIDSNVENKFNSFGATLELLGDYREVAAWHK